MAAPMAFSLIGPVECSTSPMPSPGGNRIIGRVDGPVIIISLQPWCFLRATSVFFVSPWCAVAVRELIAYPDSRRLRLELGREPTTRDGRRTASGERLP